jgi:hypothetical protein
LKTKHEHRRLSLGIGNFSLATRGLVRWLVDAGLVMLVSVVVLGLDQLFLRRRKALG